MFDAAFPISRRQLLQGGAVTTIACAASGAAQLPAASGPTVSVREFGAVSAPGRDNTAAIQRAVDAVQARGGGTVHIPEVYECGNIIVSGNGVTLHGPGAWLVNGRVTVLERSDGCRIDGLGIIDRRGDRESYALDISGRNCTLRNVSLVKEPVAGGYLFYLRQPSAFCRSTGLRLKGSSNGMMVAGRDHLFEQFEFESSMSERVGADDAFALKGLGNSTQNIVIRDGTVRGFYAIASFGSEIGTDGRSSNFQGAVRNVSVSNVAADRCRSLVYFKPGALIYDWRNGLVEDVRLDNLTLVDLAGELFLFGVKMNAARGAVIRNVVGRNLAIRARAKSQGVQHSAAVELVLFEQGAEARIEGIDLQIAFTDPYDGADHSAAAPGYPIDHIVRIEKSGSRKGQMSNISLDVTGRGSRFGGVLIGAGLDDAVTLRRAHLVRVGRNPPASLGGGGIWSDSRVTLGDVSVDSPVLPRFAGSALRQNGQ
ncbi:hypothetical protein [Sphingomonas sp.]|uniref:hypothetical protein n=1 Tax=Sphingomonas sp. TaxID=28214 RepID=UPI001790EF82|nr:hypothetical protein [Sphingomonas sp.]MBA3511188.1 hypothetical protein [Sphingomonas sp.]